MAQTETVKKKKKVYKFMSWIYFHDFCMKAVDHQIFSLVLMLKFNTHFNVLIYALVLKYR
jgi:hypothetical protein